MKIAVMSDSHDHIWNFQRALKKLEELDIRHVIHLGDLISPFMLEELDIFHGTFHLIYGNNNGDQMLFFKRLALLGDKVCFHGWFGELEISGKRIGFIHDPLLARKIAKSGEYDLVLFGHTHLWHKERLKNCTLLNPGEILGKKQQAGFATVDLKDLEIKRVLLD